MEKLELRMYGLVPYNISPIQQAIQFGHSVVEYGLNNFNDELYQDWANNYKTFIILNGGTSNHSMNRYSENEYIGTMEINLSLLNENEIKFSTFYEPDLNDMLSAITFIVDERVFNKKKYPDFDEWLILNYSDSFRVPIDKDIIDDIKKSSNTENNKIYQKWLNLIGGEENAFLKDFLKNFNLA